MCRLIETVGLPSALAGFLNLRGELTPLVRLDRLFALEEAPFHLYTHILVARRDPPLALAVERAADILELEADASLDAPAESVFGDCLEGVLRAQGRDVNLLRIERVLLAEEESRIAEFTRMAAQRASLWTEPAS